MLPQRAVIFDMDGVITDSEPLYAEALDIVLGRKSIVLDPADHRAVIGRSVTFTWQYLIDRLDLDGDIQDWVRLYDQSVSRLLSTEATGAEGLHWLLGSLKARDVHIALATGSKTNWANIILNRLGVGSFFAAIATSDMVLASKPAPDLYLLAARKLGVPPRNCLAIDDTPRGIAAANTAGMTTVAVRTESTARMNVSAANYVINQLREFDFAWIEALG